MNDIIPSIDLEENFSSGRVYVLVRLFEPFPSSLFSPPVCIVSCDYLVSDLDHLHIPPEC